MSSFRISIESTVFIPARQTDKSESSWVLVLSKYAEIHYHVIVSNIHWIYRFNSSETDRQVWISMGACVYWISWNTLPCHRFDYPSNRQLSFLRDRPTCQGAGTAPHTHILDIYLIIFTCTSSILEMNTSFYPGREHTAYRHRFHCATICLRARVTRNWISWDKFQHHNTLFHDNLARTSSGLA
jgi:hypothetical protein